LLGVQEYTAVLGLLFRRRVAKRGFMVEFYSEFAAEFATSVAEF